MNSSFLSLSLLIVLLCMASVPNPSEPPLWNFDAQLDTYFVTETNKLSKASKDHLADITNWELYQNQNRWKLMHMLGLNIFALENEKSPLKPVITGTLEEEEFRVEKLHFQSLPGLYVTGNLYMPKEITEPLPAILYVCGHGKVKENGISYGNKAHYQHHAAWFARNGYVCLIIDTNQLGEIEGTHHGTHHLNRWWWISRGYTPAGVEAWNGVRAVDYLISRPEVDRNRIGLTGRSGGGAYTWWGAAIDTRIKVAVPVAGITDLNDHIVRQCVDGHCDCMFMVNTFRWDYPKLVPLVAPRPLLISNTDRDPIFPIKGVFNTYLQGRNAYAKMNASNHLALHTTAGPHMDTQELRVHAFRWFNHYLRGTDELIDKPAIKFFEPRQLKVFDKLPEDQINTKIDELFVEIAPPIAEQLSNFSWDQQKHHWNQVLDERVLSGWPSKPKRPTSEFLQRYRHEEGILNEWKVTTDDGITELPFFQLVSNKGSNKTRKVEILDDENWAFWAPKLKALFPSGDLWKDALPEKDAAKTVRKLLKGLGDISFLCMRGAGPAQFKGDEKRQIQIRRRYYLLGQTLEVMQTYDIGQMLIVAAKGMSERSFSAEAKGSTAAMLMYASLYFEEYPAMSVDLVDMPLSHQYGPVYPNVLRYLDLPITTLLAAEKRAVRIHANRDSDLKEWQALADFSQQIPNLHLTIDD
ncbi:MAG: acetylxylan esterase [Bacteroidota bacterium]